MTRQFNFLLCVLCIALLGCGSGGSYNGGSNSTSNPTMHTGQWEFTIASTNGNPNIYMEADVSSPSGNAGSLGSYVYETALFWPQTGGSIAGSFEYCVNEQTTFSVTGNSVTAMLFSGSTQVAQATATLSADGKSMTGTYQLNGVSALCAAPVTASGTFTGQVIAPLTGTYKGTLSDGSQLNVQITQDGSYNISASGTSVLPGVTTNLTISPNPGGGSTSDSNVIGATVSGNGTATNVNGTQSFQVFGHFTADASQVSFASYNGQWATGTLTKQ